MGFFDKQSRLNFFKQIVVLSGLRKNNRFFLKIFLKWDINFKCLLNCKFKNLVEFFKQKYKYLKVQKNQNKFKKGKQQSFMNF